MVGIFLELCIPFGAACQILQKQEVEFLDVVNAKPNLPQLRCKKVIAKNLEVTDNKDAKEICIIILMLLP